MKKRCAGIVIAFFIMLNYEVLLFIHGVSKSFTVVNSVAVTSVYTVFVCSFGRRCVV